jgi:hypothetical protein
MRTIARGAVPEFRYSRVYRAKLKRWKSALRVDVEPYDTTLPPMADVPLKVGIPGAEVKLAPGHDVAVGWEDARPDRPYVTTWTPGAQGTIPLRLSLPAELLELGAIGGGVEPLEYLPMFQTYRGMELARDALLGTWIAAVSAAIAGDPNIPGPLKTPVAAVAAPLATAQTQFSAFDWISTKVKNA